MGIEDSLAQNISRQTGVPAATVQVFIALSKPVRSSLRAFLQAQAATLRVTKNELLGKASRGNVVAERINKVGNALLDILSPIDIMLAAMPLDSVVKESPELASFLQEIATSIPIKIPATQATVIAGIGGFDFFDGITNYRDLRDKLDEIRFRAVRATALSTYAETGVFLTDNQLTKIDKYIQIIELLNLE